MRPLRTLFFLVALAVSVFAQNLKPVADRLAAQNALSTSSMSPIWGLSRARATAFGDYRYNDKLGDRSLDAIARFHKTDEAFLTRLEAIPTTGFSDQDQLSHNLLIRVLRQRIAAYALDRRHDR
jgi:uncharacterized protein (DUF885 family)